MKRRTLWLRRGLAALAVAACAVLIGYRGGAASYLLFWASLLPPVYALLWRLDTGRRFQVLVRVAEPQALRGDRVRCALVLVNRGFLPVTDLYLSLSGVKLRFDGVAELRETLRPGEAREQGFTLLCLHCGEAGVCAEAVLRDPFGLTERRLAAVESLRVLPRTRSLSKLLIAPPEEREQRTRPRTYLGERSPSGELRAYQPGDDVRRVHWKASALQGRPMLRTLEPEGKETLLLLPDGRASLPEGAAGWLAEDSIREGTLTIADYFLRHAIPLGVRADRDRGVRVTGPEDLRRLYALMSGDYFVGAARPDELMELDLSGQTPARRYILLTWEADEALLRRCARCLGLGAEVTLLYIGEDPGVRERADAVRRLDFRQISRRRDVLAVLGGEGGAR